MSTHTVSRQHYIRLLNCSPDVRKILSVSNFEQLFQIG